MGTLLKTGRKKLWRRVLLIIGMAVVIMPALFVPYTPRNAVRLCILENGHPVSAVFAFPMKMTREDSVGYSGGNVLAYYHILIPFNISLGGMQAHTQLDATGCECDRIILFPLFQLLCSICLLVSSLSVHNRWWLFCIRDLQRLPRKVVGWWLIGKRS